MKEDNTSIERLIIKQFTGSLLPDEEVILKKWLSESVENKKYFFELHNVWQVSYPVFDPDKIDENEALSEVLSKIEKKKKKHYKLLYVLQRVAVILFLPFLLTSLYIIYNQHQVLSSEIVYQEVFAPYGTNSKVNLPDGSFVWLNSGSMLKYPVVFKDGERSVYLEGEAYFSVTSDLKNPFSVETKNTKIIATGTEFNIDSYTSDSLLSVTLVNGKVNVVFDNGSNVAMRPKQQITFYENTGKHELYNTDPYKYCAWKDGFLVFRDDRLDYVFKKIGQMYNIDINVSDSEIASHRYRATFENETLDEILELIKLSAPLEYNKTERTKSGDGYFQKGKIEIYKSENE